MTMDKALKTGRSGTAARPLTNATGRNLRLGTASMLSDSDPTTFINPARLDIAKYAERPALAKALFRSVDSVLTQRQERQSRGAYHRR